MRQSRTRSVDRGEKLTWCGNARCANENTLFVRFEDFTFHRSLSINSFAKLLSQRRIWGRDIEGCLSPLGADSLVSRLIAFDESFSRRKAVYTIENSENQKFAPLAVLECRGCEITSFDPKGVWSAKGAESNTKFVSFYLLWSDLCFLHRSRLDTDDERSWNRRRSIWVWKSRSGTITTRKWVTSSQVSETL